MANTMSKIPLSGSTNGRGIKVTTASPIDGTDTTIHTAVTGTADTDYITLFAYNDDTVTRTLHLGWGGTTDPDDLIIMDIPSQSGLVLVVADVPLRNSLVVVASASAANVIVIYGHVTRIDVP
jgi:hypothetical protein